MVVSEELSGQATLLKPQVRSTFAAPKEDGGSAQLGLEIYSGQNQGGKHSWLVM